MTLRPSAKNSASSAVKNLNRKEPQRKIRKERKA